MPSKVTSIRNELIPLIIETVKKHGLKYEMTPLKALEERSYIWFGYSKSHLDNIGQTIDLSEQKRVKKLESDMSEFLHILDQQGAFTHLEYVIPLVEVRRLKEYPDSCIFLDLFNYGYLMGKRAERARRIKCKKV